ncbi:MAG TPA: hypothetical protein VFH45_05530 [Acidimicrobiales bacterium]|nr:hypothetical protein [Acidimicrobiales bacterium]
MTHRVGRKGQVVIRRPPLRGQFRGLGLAAELDHERIVDQRREAARRDYSG